MFPVLLSFISRDGTDYKAFPGPDTKEFCPDENRKGPEVRIKNTLTGKYCTYIIKNRIIQKTMNGSSRTGKNGI